MFWTIQSTALSYSLNNLSSERAQPSYSTKNRGNGTVNRRLDFGPANQIIPATPENC